MYKKIILTLLFICFASCSCGKKEVLNDDLTTILQRDKLVVGVRDDSKPFGFLDSSGVRQGYDIDLAKIIAKVILGDSNKIEFVPVTASNRILKLSSGEVDMLIATMSITNQRQQILDFSIPYYVAGQAILVNSSSNYTSIRDFAGKRMIIVYGSTSERNLRMNVPEIQVIGYKTYPEAFSALKSGKASGMIADDTILYGYMLGDKSVKLLPKRYSKEPYAVVFRKGIESQKLLQKVNYIIENLQSTGRLNRLQDFWHIRQ